MNMMNPAAGPGGEAGIGGDTRQYVTFYVQNEMFAVPLAEVQEIIRMPDVVGVPKSPASLEGLANLRGTVMSVTSLRRIFSFADVPHDDATRVVVINQGVPVGFVVDRMAAVVTADPDQIEPAESIGATVDTDLLRGMIKGVNGHPMIMIIDPAHLLQGDGLNAGRRAARVAAAAAEARDTLAEANDELQLVSFEVAGQEYALGIESVQEIVQVPESISRIPCTDRHVLGVVTLRNRLLPLVSLRAMFNLPESDLDERSKIVVVPLDEKNSVGVVMDTVREVLRVRKDIVDPLPNMLGDGRGEIQSICRLNGGKRLVSILSADRLFQHDAVRTAMAAAEGMEEEQVAEILNDSRTAVVDEEEQFVVFRLGNEEYGAPIESVNEIVRVPDELTRVPKTAAFIEGVVNLRGSVLPVIDQRRRFDLPEVERNDRQRIMVFTINGVRTGFIVDSVSEVLKIARSAIGPTPSLSDEQAKLISRVANLEKHKRMVLLLNVENLLDAAEIGAIGQSIH
ncbi:chemotaxis protein CheW [Azospirillum sp. SYSU D00513]|uniref:chemotaxis protein CheW n=1 Tax=Azospirillum sp. SYSU D00513 TaxID=2812561 RepID=UPI001A96F424|nr:chemotaxis protein CheW [Azospirillum sp. SYSU D00513]